MVYGNLTKLDTYKIMAVTKENAEETPVGKAVKSTNQEIEQVVFNCFALEKDTLIETPVEKVVKSTNQEIEKVVLLGCMHVINLTEITDFIKIGK